MRQSDMSGPIAYLAAQMPALSETFVYEELWGLRRLGVKIVPVSVRRPGQPAHGQEELARQVQYLYEGAKWRLVFEGLWNLPRFKGSAKALGWLVADLWECGPFRLATWKLGYQLLAAVRLAGILDGEKCTHLHVHFANAPTQIGMYAASLAGIPFTFTAHANDIFEHGVLLKTKATRSAMMLTISDYNRRYLEGRGVEPTKLTLIRCGVREVETKVEPVYGVKSHYRIGTLGRLVETKGMDVVIRALAELKERPYRVELVVAGDGPLLLELKRLVVNLGLADRVCFRGGIPHNEVGAWMRDLDLFVLACKRNREGDMDGIPVVLMEAMSELVPVISTRLSGIPELVLDGKTGLLANPDDPSGLARKIDRFLTKPALRKEMASNGIEYVRREFSQQVNLMRLMKCLTLDSEPSRE